MELTKVLIAGKDRICRTRTQQDDFRHFAGINLA